MKKINMNSFPFRIIQLTDLHLMHQKSDDETFEMLEEMLVKHNPDLVVITGDLTMHFDNELLLRRISSFFDQFKIPWTFTFGNHDHESSKTLEEQAQILCESNTLIFENNHKHLRGCGDFTIELRYQDQLIATLFLVDSHNDTIIKEENGSSWSYDFIDDDQIKNIKNQLEQYHQNNKSFVSLIFFHIPIKEMAEVNPEDTFLYQGNYFETVCCSKVQTHLFSQLKSDPSLKGIFFGHDHTNDFQIEKEGVVLAYGRCSGHYNYMLPEFKKGFRIIEIDSSIQIKTFVEQEK